MAGQIVVSSIKTDSDNSISFLANTGATIFSANLASGLSASSFGDNTITSDKIVSVANTKISGNIVSSQITSVSNTQLTGTITNSQLGTGAVEQYFADTGYEAQFRNRIINGDMKIDQRNAGASVNPNTSTDVFPVDRFFVQASQNSKCTAQQSSTAPTGFTKSLLITSSSAYSVGTNDYFDITHKIEGFNTADLMFGTANAKTITLSFWVRSSLTGTFGGSFFNNAFNRSYPFSYTISSADTWEQKTVTIAGDTTGTWTTDNTCGLGIAWGLGVGTTYSNTAGAWTGSGEFSVTGAVSVVGTSGATFYLTGVQLEVGSVATEFERRPYGTELALAQRYYQVLSAGAMFAATTNGTTQFSNIGVPLATPMRSTPTVGSNDYAAWYSSADGVGSLGLTMTIASYSTNASTVGGTLSGFSGLTDNKIAVLRPGNAFRLSAEL